MKIVFQKSNWLDDWYYLDVSDIGSVHCDECGHLLKDDQYFGADVEGSAEHMRAMARAIRERGDYSARRCAVRAVRWFESDKFYVWSPRNSTREGELTAEQADDLASQIEAMLGKDAPDAP